MSRVTDEMVQRTCVMIARSNLWSDAFEKHVRAALEAVEAALCAQEPGPFVLSVEARERIHEARDPRTGIKEHAPYEPGSIAYTAERATVLHETVECLADELSRAERTLGPQPAQGGEWVNDSLVTEQMVRVAIDAFLDANSANYTTVGFLEMRAALAAALKVYWPAPVQALEERIRELESAKPVAQELSKEERSDVEAVRGTIGNPDSSKARVIAIIDRLAPKPAPSEPADPVRELLAEMNRVCTYPNEGYYSLHHWRSRLEAALAARDAQKAGG
jgi:hypothetical protein